jgi:hypothetical protein
MENVYTSDGVPGRYWTRLLQGEMIGIAQRNVNAILNQLRKLAGAKSLGEILDLQAAYCRNQQGHS